MGLNNAILSVNQANCWLGITLFVEKQDFSSNLKSGISPLFSLIIPRNRRFRMEKLIDIMEEDDDVQNIWHNWEE